MATCDPNTARCAKRAVDPTPDFCRECGLARAEYSSPGSGRTSPLKQATPTKPVGSRGSRPQLQMKPPNLTTVPQPQTAPQPPAAPPAAHERVSQPAPQISQSNPAIARVLLGGTQKHVTTTSPPQSHDATRMQSTSMQSVSSQSVSRRRVRRRQIAIIGLAILSTIVAVVGAFVIQR